MPKSPDRAASATERDAADPHERRASNLTLQMSTGTGTGPTSLAAFDAALVAVGAGDYNLIRLSSVIPSGSRIRHVERVAQQARWGDQLYCVYASEISDVPGRSAAAGIGWVVKSDGSGSGLLVEHHGATESEVAFQIRSSLAAMTAVRGGGFDAPQLSTVSALCRRKPVCVLAMAAFSTGWWEA